MRESKDWAPETVNPQSRFQEFSSCANKKEDNGTTYGRHCAWPDRAFQRTELPAAVAGVGASAVDRSARISTGLSAAARAGLPQSG